MIYVWFINKPSDSPTKYESDREDDNVISLHILYNAHQKWQLCIVYNFKHNFIVI